MRDSVAASGRLAEVLCDQSTILLPGMDNPQPDHVQLEYSGRLIKLLQPFSAIEDLVRQHYKGQPGSHHCCSASFRFSSVCEGNA